jgi:hypothetical protein
MVLSHEDQDPTEPHPYWYGRIIGIFHVQVRHIGPYSKSTEIQRVDFLWVRWFGRDVDYRAGWKRRRLHRLGFLGGDDEGAFGFLDPNEIIRGAHLIPAFAWGRTSMILGPSIARQDSENNEDWYHYYVNMFVAVFFMFARCIAKFTKCSQVCRSRHGNALPRRRRWPSSNLR